MEVKRPPAIWVGFLAALSVASLACGCGGKKADRSVLILATTTSTQDSGLLDELIPMFEKDNPYSVKVIAAGSGEAMRMGRMGECDVMLVHSPADEEEMVAEGYAVERNAVMHNDFVIVGPAADPAKVREAASARDAFAAIAASQSSFVSRADGSGTHVKEKSIWKAAGLDPSGAWYMESGKGMGDTLRIASEKAAYTLSDRGTYLGMKDELDLEILCEGDPSLLNDYHVMNVNPEKWPQVEIEGARAFNAFCVSREAQEFLKGYGVDEYGEPLFYPDAL